MKRIAIETAFTVAERRNDLVECIVTLTIGNSVTPLCTNFSKSIPLPLEAHDPEDPSCEEQRDDSSIIHRTAIKRILGISIAGFWK